MYVSVHLFQLATVRYTCRFVLLHLYMYACMYLFMHACIHWIYVCAYFCLLTVVRLYVCACMDCTCMYHHMRACIFAEVCVYECMCVWLYQWMYVCNQANRVQQMQLSIQSSGCAQHTQIISELYLTWLTCLQLILTTAILNCTFTAFVWRRRVRL